MSNVINGTVPTKENIKGSINTVYGKDGKSAYVVAVENGFEGTVTEWLESLKGDTGVYIGSGDMPENCNVQIDPDGDDFLINQAVEMAQSALEKSNEANAKYEACVGATENAIEAANNANAVRNEIETGGFIESLKEMNNGGKFSFWTGTEEEYNTETNNGQNVVENRFYIITDDPTLETIEGNKIETEFAESGHYYEKWANGTFKAKAKYTFNGTITAPYGNAYCTSVHTVSFLDLFYPTITNYLAEVFDISPTISNTNELLGVNLTSYALPTSDDEGSIQFYIFSHKEISTATTATVTFDLLGRWK